MLKEFSYIVKLVVQNSHDGSLFYVSKEFFDNIEIGEDDYFVPFPISPSKTDDTLREELEKYAAKNKLNINDLQVISKEITPNSDFIDVYFDEEDDNVHTYNPDINIEFVPTIYKPTTPQFFTGHMDGEDSILWSWETVSGCAYRIIDAEGEIVANIGVSNSMFVEDGVVMDTSYIRSIVAYNADGDSEPSEYAIVTTTSEKKPESESSQSMDLGEYTSSDIKEYTSSEQTSRYFQSGIGDNYDLLVEKTDESHICERFSVYSGVKAINNVEQRVYTPIDVEYYVKATGDEIVYGDPDSEFKLRVIPWPVVNTMISINSVISEPITFDIEYSLDVFYQARRTPSVKLELKGSKAMPEELPLYEGIHITLKDENGDISDSDVMYSVEGVGVTITKDGILKATKETVAIITATYIYYDLKITKDVVFSLSATMPTYSLANDYELSSKYGTKLITGYRLCKKTLPYKRSFTIDGIKDKEKLSSVEPYIRNSDNDILSSPVGTIKIMDYHKIYGSNDDIETIIEDNDLYVTTKQNERIYIYKKIFESKISIDQKKSLNIIDGETLIYRNKYNTIYLGNEMPDTTIDYLDVHDSVTIYDDEGNISPSTITGRYPSIMASIDTPEQNTIVSGITNKSKTLCKFPLIDLFKALPAEDYTLEIVELKIDGEVKYATTDSESHSVIDGNKFVYIKNISGATLEVIGIPSKSYSPFTKKSATYKCTINGKKPYVYDYDGKENFVAYAPIFKFDYETKNTEYEVVAWNKADKRIDAEFENGHKYRATKRNGDVLIISSNDYEVITDFRHQIVSECTSQEFTLLEKEKTKFTTYLYNPRFNRAAELASLNDCEVFITSSNPNISIASEMKTIDFTLPEYKDLTRVPIEFDAEIISASQTSWSPVINSGYYFLNNKEYYLYGESNLTGVFRQEEVAKTKYFFISVIANIESKTNSLPVVRLLSGATSFLSGVFGLTAIEGEKLTLDSTVVSGKKIYYDDGTYITDNIVLGSDLTNLTVQVDGDHLDNVRIYANTYNGLTWTDWFEIPNDYKIESEEYIQEFKIKLELSRLVDKEIDYSESTGIYLEGDIKADGYTSSNMLLQNGLITLSDISKPGYYESPIYDVIEGSYYVFIEPQSLSDIEGKYELYIAFSKTKDFTDSAYIKTAKRVSVGENKYYRYKLFIPASSKFGFNEIRTITTYISTSQISISPAIRSIETSSIPKEWTFAGMISKSILCEIKRNMKWKYVTDYNVLDMIYPDIAIAGIRNPRVQNIIVNTMDDDIEVLYDASKDGRISARTKTSETEIVDSKYLKLYDKYFGYITPVPKLGAPVVLMCEDIPLTQVSYFDADGELSEYVEEVFTYNGSDVLTAMYNEIDLATVAVSNVEDVINVQKVINNKIVIDNSNLIVGDILTVSYKVKYSFGCDLQHSPEMAKVVIYLDSLADEDDYNKIKAYCETSDTGLYNGSEIEINPMYNPNNTGFIYLSSDVQMASKIDMTIDKTEFKASTVEDVCFNVRVTDAYGNTVPSVAVRIVTLYGKIKMTNNITDKFGIVTAKYIHPTFECEDIITANISSTELSCNTKIAVDKDSKFISLTSVVEESKYIIDNGQEIIIRARLFEDDMQPLESREIVVEMESPKESVYKSSLTDSSGECFFSIIPEINFGSDICNIKVSYLSIENNIKIKVVDRS